MMQNKRQITNLALSDELVLGSWTSSEVVFLNIREQINKFWNLGALDDFSQLMWRF